MEWRKRDIFSSVRVVDLAVVVMLELEEEPSRTWRGLNAMRLGFICIALAATGIRVLGIRASEAKTTTHYVRREIGMETT